MHVLLVEDAPLQARLVRRLLEKRNHRVTASSSLAEACELLSTDHYDLLLTDMDLGDGDGTTLLRICRADPELASLPVVCVSADPRQREGTLALGFDAFFTKPLNTATFAEELELAVVTSRSHHIATAGKALLDELRDEFVGQVTGWLRELRLAFGLASNGDATSRVVLRRRAHQIHGFAGSIGFGTIGDAARKVEELADDGASLDVRATELALRALERAVAGVV